MKKLFSISFLFIFITSCQSQATIPPTTINLTNTPESTSTPTSENTLTPTNSPTLIPTTIPVKIEFPDWVKNPETQILLIPVGTQDKGYENMALFNAETGERFDVPFTNEVGDYFWMPDGSAFGFLPEDENYVFLFSIENESISNVFLSEESLKFHHHNSGVDIIRVTSSNFTDSDFLIIPASYPLSPNGKFFEYQEGYSNKYTSIFDISKNQIINISDPDDKYFDLSSEFSPDSKFLAIVEVDQEPLLYNTFNSVPTFSLRIYDLENQKIDKSYKNITFPKWSPDGTKFLFQEWIDSDYYWFGESPPCIFDTISEETECYEINGKFAYPNWSPDQTMIGFIHSGFCIIKLLSEETTCILEKLELENQKPILYKWSPDSNFISFIYDTSCPYCDYIDFPKLGVVNIVTGKYFSIGDNVSLFNLGLWRPLLNP